jgi:hypothetical protein
MPTSIGGAHQLVSAASRAMPLNWQSSAPTYTMTLSKSALSLTGDLRARDVKAGELLSVTGNQITFPIKRH